MSTPPSAAPPPRGLGFNVDEAAAASCGALHCNGHGTCPGAVPPAACDCHLGYAGQFCENTVNGSLSAPLSLSVVVVIVGLLILAFVVAKLRQRQKQERRRRVDAKQGYNIAV
ncbi:unnamed protein product [Ophioblennius macclurei]